VNQPAILPQIRRLVEESGLPPHDIAKRAKVNYQAFRRFILGQAKTYNATSAELVYHALTGKTFTRPSVGLKRDLIPLRKKGGKAA
jgi:hypothetical protein